MWLSVDDYGQLSFSFREIMASMTSYYGLRLIAGLIFFIGTILMAWNLGMTMRGRNTVPVTPPPVPEKFRLDRKAGKDEITIAPGVPAA